MFSMTGNRRPWPDVPRLLQKRRQFAELGDRSLASSVTAFLAWKALLVVARGSETGDEKQQCIRTVTMALSHHPEFWAEAESFTRALRALTQVSAAVVQDWYCDTAWEPDKSARHAEWATRSIREANELMAEGRKDATLAERVGDHLYAMRSAVLAHASVQSTGNLFQLVVPPFEQLTCHVACGGWADRAGIALDVAMEECDVE
jgi:hypothetical protein